MVRIWIRTKRVITGLRNVHVRTFVYYSTVRVLEGSLQKVPIVDTRR